MNNQPAGPEEWGFRPLDQSTIDVTPPGFVWRPQGNDVRYQLQCARDEQFEQIVYEKKDLVYFVHTPPEVFPAGKYYWRFRFTAQDGKQSQWSQIRSFIIAENASELPLPEKEDLIARIPKSHPRLFVRPEQIPELQELAQGNLKKKYEQLLRQCEDIINNPPPTEEPSLYPEGTIRNSDPWREIWWGNRTYTINALNSAATLGFTYLLGGQEEYGKLARKILLECAEWDPKGATGYRYNDEAGMPYNYYFSRTYTFINDLLSEAEKEKCREVMTIRGREMYDHLYPRHFWRPYSSHSNRAWHFLGEIGIAFLDEIPEAQEWVWFAANVFTNVYPVWSDQYGGWHEGVSYWNSYLNRFTWWADIMRVAMGIDAYQKPFFSKAGFYPMYLQPPGTRGGGFGDLTARRDSEDNVGIMTIFAAQAQNPYWQWYVEAHGGSRLEDGYIGFVRGALPTVVAKAPTDLPTSRCFWGIGQAMLNHSIMDAGDNVEVIFKSSPFGTWSHGYESNNSFLLYAFGERLFIRTGQRDSYGSDHHKNWMWQTKSTNCITVNGEGQVPHSQAAQGRIIAFHTDPLFDYVAGEAAQAYDGKLNRFTRHIFTVKPDIVVIYDQLEAPEPSTYQWYLHAVNEMKINNQHDIYAENGNAACRVNFLYPKNLQLSQTDKFDVPPRPRIKLVEYHLTAGTTEPQRKMEFVTVLQPYKKDGEKPKEMEFEEEKEKYLLSVPYKEGRVVVNLFKKDESKIPTGGLLSDGIIINAVNAVYFNADNVIERNFSSNQAERK
ncbi:MAG: DUF4962 domain-containing protein [bacterium]